MDRDMTDRQAWTYGAIAGAVVFLLLWLIFMGFLASLFWGIVVAIVVALLLLLRSRTVEDGQGHGDAPPHGIAAHGATAATPATAQPQATAGGGEGTRPPAVAMPAGGAVVAPSEADVAPATAEIDDGGLGDPASGPARDAERPAPGEDPGPASVEGAGVETAPVAAGGEDVAATGPAGADDGSGAGPSTDAVDAGEPIRDAGIGAGDGASGADDARAAQEDGAPDARGADLGAGAAAPAASAGQSITSGAEDGTKPEGMDGPREGGADDLKMIKGVGPKLEGMLNGMGIYHFDQIAAWGPEEVAWCDSHLEGFRGRVSRDDWVGQARQLASGAGTEFSQRAARDDIYKGG